MADRALTYQVKLNLAQARTEAAQLAALFRGEFANIELFKPSAIAGQFRVIDAQVKQSAQQFKQSKELETAIAYQEALQQTNAVKGSQHQQTGVTRSESQARIIAARAESQERIILARQAATAAAEAEKRTTAMVKSELAQQAAAARQAAQAQAGATGVGRGGGIGGLGASLGGALVGGVAGYLSLQGAQQLVQQAVELDRLGTQAKRAAVGFNILSGGADKAAKNLKAIQEAGGGAISELDAMTIGMQATGQGLAKTSEEFYNLTRAARAVALTSTSIHDVSNAIAQLSLAASNQSEMRFDQLMIDPGLFAKNKAEIAAANGDWTEQAVFLQASIDTIIEKYGALLETSEAQVTGAERLAVAWSNAKLALATSPVGTGIDAGFGLLAKSVTDSTAAVNNIALQINAAFGGVEERAASMAMKVQQAIDGIKGPKDAFYGLEKFFLPEVDNSQQIAALEQLQKALANTDAAVAAGIPFANEYQAAVIRVADSVLNQNDASGAAATALAAVNDWYAIAGQGAVIMAANTDVATAAQWRLNAALRANRLANTHDPSRQDSAISGVAGLDWNRFDPPAGDFDGWLRPFGKMSEAMTDSIQRQEKDRAAQEARDTSNARALAAEQKRGARAAQSAFDKAAKETEKAFKKAAAELEATLESIPGLLSTSEVTAKQLEDARNGIPQNFADDWLRRLRDEVENGKDWADVSIEEAAKRAGIDPNLPAQQILEQFSEAWNNSSLFADKANLDLFDQEFVNAQIAAKIELEEKIKQGQQNIFELFGVAADTATQAAAAVAASAGSATGGGISYGGGGGLAGAGLAGGSVGALDASITPMLDEAGLAGLQAALDAQALTVSISIIQPTTTMLADLQATFADLPAPVSTSVIKPTTKMLADLQATFADLPAPVSVSIIGPTLKMQTDLQRTFNELPLPVTPLISTTATNFTAARDELTEFLAIQVTPWIDTTRVDYATPRGELEKNLAFTPQIDFDQMITKVGPDVLDTNKTSLSNALAFKAMADFSTFIKDNETGIGVGKGLLSGAMKFAVTPDFSEFITNNGVVLGAGKDSLQSYMKFIPLIDSDQFITKNFDAIQMAKTNLGTAVKFIPTIDVTAFGAQFAGEKPVDLAGPLMDAMEAQLTGQDNYLRLLTMGDTMASSVGAGFAGHEWGLLTSPMITGILDGISTDVNRGRLVGGGKQIADIIRGGFTEQANSADWIGDVTNAIMQQIMGNIAESVQG